MNHTILAALLAAVTATPALAGQSQLLPQSESPKTIQSFMKEADARLVNSFGCTRTDEGGSLRRYTCQGMNLELRSLPNALASGALRVAPTDRKAFLGRLRTELAAGCSSFSHRETSNDRGGRSITMDCQLSDGSTTSSVILDDPEMGSLHFVTRMSEAANTGNGDAAK